MRLPALAAREGNFSPPVPTVTATHINGMGAIVSAERAAMSFNRRFSSSSLSSKRKPSGWSAWSVIDEAAELIGGNGPVDPMLAEALGQAPPEVVLAANLERDGVHWAWQLDYIDSQQWDSFGASLEMQCAIKDVLARARNAESCESAESLRRGVAPTPAFSSALFSGEALRAYIHTYMPSGLRRGLQPDGQGAARKQPRIVGGRACPREQAPVHISRRYG